MFVSTTGLLQPHLVLGPVFAMSELQAGFVKNLTGVEASFAAASAQLLQRARAMQGNAVVGASYNFVDSSITSNLMKAFGAQSDRVYLFATGTAVYAELSPEQIAWYERLQMQPKAQELQVSDDRYRLELEARGSSPDQVQEYKGRKYIVSKDGGVKLETGAGWVPFETLEAMKRYVG